MCSDLTWNDFIAEFFSGSPDIAPVQILLPQAEGPCLSGMLLLFLIGVLIILSNYPSILDFLEDMQFSKQAIFFAVAG